MSSQQHQSISNYIKSFDGIRGFCCLLILFYHFPFRSFNLPSSIVYIGLHCFFIMSAFLITKNLLRDKERSVNFWHCFRIFYIKRTARIFPLYFFYLLLILSIALVFKVITHQSFGILAEFKKNGWMLLSFTYNLKTTFMLFQNQSAESFVGIAFPHLWSLSLEEQFYIFIIFVAWFANKRMLQFICVFFIIVMPISRILGYYWIGTITNDDWLRTLILWHSPLFQFDAFFYGIALTVFDLKKSKLYIYLLALSFVIIAAFGITNAVICAEEYNTTFFSAYREDKYFYHNGGIFFMDSLVNLFCALWFLTVIYFPEKFRILSNKFIVDAGEITYGLYVFQFMILTLGLITAYLFNQAGLPYFISDILGAVVYVLINFFFSGFVYRKIELPVVVWKDKVLKRVYAEKKST